MRLRAGIVGAVLFLAVPASGQMTTEALLDTLQHTAFRFFWEQANPDNGLIKDRGPVSAPSSIASVGFGLSAICVGVDRNYLPRDVAAARVLRTLKTFWEGPQGSGDAFIGNFGLFYHFLDMTTARRTWNSELSTIDTGLLLAGIIDAQQYFNRSDSSETAIRALADSIYYRMNWNLMRNFNPGILMGWMPQTGFLNFGQWVGYNEAMVMYILAMGSPTYPVDADAWMKWTGGYLWQTHYGQTYVVFPPLFGHQYSHCWIDFRSIQDSYMRGRGITYFENSRRATLAQRAYAIANPGGHVGYGDSLWGITASDTPTGYKARGAPPAENDDGTITPTAPISSIPFAPEEVMAVIHKMWNSYRAQLWTSYGFRDAFHLGLNWWDPDIIGIDQGPIILMIENYRTQSVWNRFMESPYVQRGLQVAGFTPVSDVAEEATIPSECVLEQNYPNPFNPSTTISFGLPAGTQGRVTLRVYDALGRKVADLVDDERPAGTYLVDFDASGLTSGTYFYRLQSGAGSITRSLTVLK